MKRTTMCFATVAAILAGLSLASRAAAEDVQALAQAYNASGLELLQRLAASPGNVVLSPYSIGSAMAMARSGARGETEAEMARVLHHRLDRAATDAANADLLKILGGYDKSTATPTCERGLQWTGRRCEGAAAANGSCPSTAEREGNRCVARPTWRPASAKLLMANALLLPAAGKAAVSADYQRLIQTRYRGEVLAQVGQEPIGLDQVNNWVRSRTEGKIPGVLDRLDPDAVAVLLNAIYFQAHWAARFNKTATTDDAFHLTGQTAGSQAIKAPMMHQTGHFALVARPGYRAIRLPYDIPNLAMVIVLPERTDGLADVLGRFDAHELAALEADLDPARPKLAALALPRFKASTKADLKGLFGQLGMHAAFDPHRANFSGIVDQPTPRPLVIGQIAHRAIIDVMEEGTEAAAATAVVIEMATAIARPQQPEQPEPFVVDHPFLFLVVDRTSGALLFAGRVADPR
jgi:serpin B